MSKFFFNLVRDPISYLMIALLILFLFVFIKEHTRNSKCEALNGIPAYAMDKFVCVKKDVFINI